MKESEQNFLLFPSHFVILKCEQNFLLFPSHFVILKCEQNFLLFPSHFVILKCEQNFLLFPSHFVILQNFCIFMDLQEILPFLHILSPESRIYRTNSIAKGRDMYT